MKVAEVGAHRRVILEEPEKAHIYIEQPSSELNAKDAAIPELRAQNAQIAVANAAIPERLGRLEESPGRQSVPPSEGLLGDGPAPACRRWSSVVGVRSGIGGCERA
jgi:hypothetical protein